MSWRAFCTLLAGLSGDSRVVLAVREAQGPREEEVITDAEEAEKAAAKAWGMPH